VRGGRHLQFVHVLVWATKSLVQLRRSSAACRRGPPPVSLLSASPFDGIVRSNASNEKRQSRRVKTLSGRRHRHHAGGAGLFLFSHISSTAAVPIAAHGACRRAHTFTTFAGASKCAAMGLGKSVAPCTPFAAPCAMASEPSKIRPKQQYPLSTLLRRQTQGSGPSAAPRGIRGDRLV